MLDFSFLNACQKIAKIKLYRLTEISLILDDSSRVAKILPLACERPDGTMFWLERDNHPTVAIL